jgi:predicted nucleotidyltransferase
MLTQEQINILSVFAREPFKRVTFRQVKELSRQKSNNVTQIALKSFENEGIVRMEKTGNVKSYSLDLDNGLALSYLNLIGEIELQGRNLPKGIVKALEEMQDRISRRTEFFILLVFGSYADGKATARSDLDVAVIVENQEMRKEITPYLETVKRRTLTKVDYHILTREEFLEMLASEQENLGKQIYTKSVIIRGRIEYYSMIKRLAHGRIG